MSRIVNPGWICAAAALTAFPALAADDRITASPTLPKTALERQGERAAARPVPPEVREGQAIYSNEGQASARVAQVVRDKDGKPLRVILTTSDQIRRYTPIDGLYAGRGRIEMHLTRRQIEALPRVETE